MAEQELCNPLTEMDLLENDIVYPAELPKVDHDVKPVDISTSDKIPAIVPTNVMFESKFNNDLNGVATSKSKVLSLLPNAPILGKRFSNITNFKPPTNKNNNYI